MPGAIDPHEDVRPGAFAEFVSGVREKGLLGSGFAGEAKGDDIVAVVDCLEPCEGAALVAEKGAGDDTGGRRVGRGRGGFDPPRFAPIPGGGNREAEAGLCGIEETVGLEGDVHRGEEGVFFRKGQFEDRGAAPKTLEMFVHAKGRAAVGGDRFKNAPAADDEPVMGVHERLAGGAEAAVLHDKRSG